jgi:hypothetical protein
MSDDRTAGFEDAPRAGYADLAAIAKSLTPEDERLDEPPADLWARIEAAVTPGAAAGGATARRLRRSPAAWLLAAAAAVLLVASVAAVLVADRGPDTVADVALVNTGLDPRGATSTGEARLSRRDDGIYVLDVTVHSLPATGADQFFELWVIDRRVEGMVSLGPLHRGGRFELPAGVDPGTFPVVDISIEPTDGIPTHSGESILRGILET